MTTGEWVAISGAVGAILSQILNYGINKYKVSRQSTTEEKKLELDWQKEFNEATKSFRAELQCTIKELRSEVLELRNDVERLRDEKIKLEEEVIRLRTKNEVQIDEIVSLKKQNAQLETDRRKLEDRVKELERKQNGGK